MVSKNVMAAAALAAVTVVSTACAVRPSPRTPAGASVIGARLRTYVTSAPRAAVSGLNMSTVGFTQSLCGTCEQIYDNAQAGNWQACSTRCGSLNTQWNGVQNAALAPVTQNARRNAVAKTLSQLNAAVASKNTAATKNCANKLYKDFSDINSLYNPSKTADIRSIKYYGREINANLDAGNLSAARQNCSKLVASWNSARRTADSSQCQSLVNSLSNSLGKGNTSGAKVSCSSLIGKCSALETEMAGRML